MGSWRVSSWWWWASGLGSEARWGGWKGGHPSLPGERWEWEASRCSLLEGRRPQKLGPGWFSCLCPYSCRRQRSWTCGWIAACAWGSQGIRGLRWYALVWRSLHFGSVIGSNVEWNDYGCLRFVVWLKVLPVKSEDQGFMLISFQE